MIMVINKSQEKARNKVGFQALSHSAQSYFASPIYRVQRKRKFLTFFNSSLPKVTRFWISSGLCGKERGLNPALISTDQMQRFPFKDLDYCTPLTSARHEAVHQDLQ